MTTAYHSVSLTDEEHNHFVENHPNGDLLQLTDWAQAKAFTGWHYKKIAIADCKEQVQGVSLLLFKAIKGTPWTFAYASKGFVVDYNNHEAVIALRNAAIEVAKEEKAIYLKIDPDLQREGSENILKFLTSIGFHHTGFKDGMNEQYIQPRQTMYTPIDKNDDDLLASYDTKARNLVRKALKSGLETQKASGESLDVFAQLMQTTGERDGFATRNITYFQSIYEKLHPNGHMDYFLIRLMPNQMAQKAEEELASIQKDLEKVSQKKDSKKKENQLKELSTRQNKTEQLIADAHDLQEKYPEGFPLSGALLGFCGQKCYYLYAASSNAYRTLNPNYQLQYDMMRYARNKGAKTYDFGGVSVNPSPDSPYLGLWLFKKMWGTKVSDKIGEFDYVLNKPLYFLITFAFPRIRHFKQHLYSKK